MDAGTVDFDQLFSGHFNSHQYPNESSFSHGVGGHEWASCGALHPRVEAPDASGPQSNRESLLYSSGYSLGPTL